MCSGFKPGAAGRKEQTTRLTQTIGLPKMSSFETWPIQVGHFICFFYNAKWSAENAAANKDCKLEQEGCAFRKFKFAFGVAQFLMNMNSV